MDIAATHEFCVVQHKISCKETMPNIFHQLIKYPNKCRISSTFYGDITYMDKLTYFM